MMKEAMDMCSKVVSMKDSLSGVLDTKIESVTGMIGKADSTVDSTTVAGWNSSLASLSDLKAQLTTWASNMKVLPSAEEMAKGASNPFGDMSPDKVLEEVKGYMTQITEMKEKVSAAVGM